MPDEIELKLSLDVDAMQRLRRHPMLRALTRGEPRRRRLFAIYFDTPDGLLERRGMSLRVRRDSGRWTQTLKGPDVGEGSFMRRVELECLVPQPVPDLSGFDPAVRDTLLEPEICAGEWAEVVRMQVTRVMHAVRLFDTDIMLSFDRGVVEAGGNTATLCEVELELINGRTARLYEFAMMLSEAASFHIQRKSKLQQGLALRQGPAVLKASKQAPVTIAAGAGPGEVFSNSVRACLNHLQANEQVAIRGEDSEGVHQARVAIRRLRALVSVYKDVIRGEILNLLRNELRWLQGALGPARDWDVFLEETLARLDTAFPGEPGLALLRKAAEEERAEGYRLVAETLNSARYVRLELQLALWLDTGEWLDTPAAARFAEPDALTVFAGDILDRATKKLRKAGQGRDSLDAEGLHAVRILAKKLRYAGDFFEDLYPHKATRRFLKHLAGLQEALGSLNDAAVAQRLLATLQARLSGQADPVLVATAVGLVRGWQEALVVQDRGRFDGLWTEWRHAERFWKPD